MKQIGVFLCHCYLSPLERDDTDQVLKAIGGYPGVTHTGYCPDMCLNPNLDPVKNMVVEKALDGVVLTGCSPSVHFDDATLTASRLGLEESKVEIVDMKPPEIPGLPAGASAPSEGIINLIKSSVDRLQSGLSEETSQAPFTKRALVIGGGVAGIQAALDIADAGYQVVVVERDPSIGGHMVQYAEVFPTLDCPQCIMTPKMVEASQHPNITLHTYAEVQKVTGSAGDFDVEILHKAKMVDHTKCTGCGTCWQRCPVKVPSEFDAGVFDRTAIYIPFAQAVPAKPVIDTDHCRYIRYRQFIENEEEGKKPPECRVCERLCQAKAIDWEQQPEVVTEKFGAIIVATGFDLMPSSELPEYAEDPDIINGIQFERLLAPGGPTAGVVKRPSDGKIPKEVVFVSCAGSRDPEHGVPYCSRVCCMYLAKQAILYKHAVPDGQPYIFYIDIRTTGKGYEEFVQRAVEEGVLYLRGKVSKIFREGDKLTVWGADTLSGKSVQVSTDLVVLGTSLLPSTGSADLADRLGILADEHGFITELHPKLQPLETSMPGVFLAGTAQGPKDIPDSVAQASGAAGKVITLFARERKPKERLVTG